jgi:IS30 family transposase
MSRKRGTDRRGQIPDMVSIHVRPPEVDDRVMPGHWEGDFIKGAGNQSSVGVLVERTSRLVLLAKMEDATAASALAGFTAKLNSIADSLNSRPRATDAFHSPFELFERMLATASITSASVHYPAVAFQL